MATAPSQLRYSPLPGQFLNSHLLRGSSSLPKFPLNNNNNSQLSPLQSSNVKLHTFLLPKHQIPCPAIGGGGGGGGVGGGVGDGGGNGGWSDGESHDDDDDCGGGFGPIGGFLSGWRSRVLADPQFPFKVLMEEVVGVSSCVLGDMASRPNFGLNELDFVFSTLVVGSILNFVLMYLLAPTAAASSSSGLQTLPWIFAGCPTSHMFEPGPYGLMSRLGTFVYKGTVFAAVGFAAGLVGTAISNGLIQVRKKMDSNFETPNKQPPTILNAMTWAAHMGVSSNLRYQTLNGVEFLLAKGLSPFVFKSSVIVLRCLNNVLGGMSFVVLARLTGSQSVVEKASTSTEKENLIAQQDTTECLTNNDSAAK